MNREQVAERLVNKMYEIKRAYPSLTVVEGHIMGYGPPEEAFKEAFLKELE